MMPGETAFTRMPFEAYSMASAFVAELMPPFVRLASAVGTAEMGLANPQVSTHFTTHQADLVRYMGPLWSRPSEVGKFGLGSDSTGNGVKPAEAAMLDDLPRPTVRCQETLFSLQCNENRASHQAVDAPNKHMLSDYPCLGPVGIGPD
jgi:hypothetical protein